MFVVYIIDIYQKEVCMSAEQKQPTAKIFMSGRSQAVRLPKEFRLPGTEVNIRRVGNAIMLEPAAEKFDVDAWRSKLQIMGSHDFLPDGLSNDPPVEPDDSINFDWLDK
jgi:antitoxin VapB